jgi:hypothetical protein
MADQAGHNEPQRDDAALEPASRAAAGGEDMRLLMITFAGSLGAILAGTIIVGLSLVFLRVYHKLPNGLQTILDGAMPLAMIGTGLFALAIAKEGRNWRRLIPGAPEFSWGWLVPLIVYIALAAAGVLFFIGLAVGVK